MSLVLVPWQQGSPILLSQATSVYAEGDPLKLDASALGRVRGHFAGETGHEHLALDGDKPITRLGDIRAELVQVHIHRGSEHDVEARESEGEIHLVHAIQGAPGRSSTYLVLGILFEKGEGGPKLFDAWVAERASKGQQQKDGAVVELDLGGLVDPAGSFYRYEGSLTTSPYAESVSWVVFRAPAKVPAETLDKLARTEGHDREHQALDRRFVLRNFR